MKPRESVGLEDAPRTTSPQSGSKIEPSWDQVDSAGSEPAKCHTRIMKSYKQSAPFGIGEPRQQKKRREDRLEVEWIKQVREKVFARSPSCQICHGSRRDECMGLPDQLHEDPPRSKTRGLPLQERFNERVCGRLCAACHRDVTEYRIEIAFHDEKRGFKGGVVIVADHYEVL